MATMKLSPFPILSTLLCSAALLTAPVQAQTVTPLVKINDKSLPFSVSVPKGWFGLNLKDGLGGITVASQPKPPAALIRLLFIPKNGKAVALNNEFVSFEKAIKESGAALTFKGEEVVKYGGVSGVLRQYVIKSKTDTLVMRIWFGNGAKNFYSFQLTVPANAYQRLNPLFDRVLASVQF